jgi:hypothetical protein
VFFRVEEIEELPAHKFFPRARRLVAYKGAFRMRVEEEQEKKREGRTEKKTSSTDWARERKAREAAKAAKVPAPKKDGDKVTYYADPAHNVEAAQLGLFESGAG